jgi:hypothetical protein
MRKVLAGIAEFEHEVIREQMSENKMIRWKAHRAFIGKVPFGYVWNKTSKAVEINPEEAQIYRHIVDLYLHEGLSDLNIVLKLKEEGIKLRGRKYPATQTIAYMLKNPAYYGYLVVNKHEYDGDRRVYELKGDKQIIKMKPVSQHITFPMPALISKTIWDEIQAKRTFNKSKSKRTSLTLDYWLRDLLICDECKGKILAVTHSRARKDGSLPRYYGCYHHKAYSKRLEASGLTRCKLPLINAEQIEDMVWSKLLHTLTFGGFEISEYHPSKLESLVNTAHYDDKIAHIETMLHHQESELKSKERGKERIMSLLESDDYDQEDFRRKLSQTNDQIITIQASISDAQAKIEALREAKANNDEFVEFIKGNQEWLASIRQELDDLSPIDKKRLAESLIDGKINVWIGRLDEGEKGPAWAISNFRFSFNRAIFETLIAEGKLSILTKNGGNRSGSPRGGAPRPPTDPGPRSGSPAPRRTASPRPGARGGGTPLSGPGPGELPGASGSSRPR